jgi:hypothetical protein
MKKPYQIEAQRAVKQFEAMATEGNPAVQMMLPMAEMVGWLRKGVGELNAASRLAVDGAFDCRKKSGSWSASVANDKQNGLPAAGEASRATAS